MRCFSRSGFLVFGLLLCTLPVRATVLHVPLTDSALEQTAELIRYALATMGAERVDGVPLALPDQVSDYYWQHDFRPVWIGRQGVIAAAVELLNALRRAEAEGLPVSDYPLAAIERRLRDAVDEPLRMAQLDLLLTDAFLHYSLNVHSGRLDPRQAGGDWYIPYRPADVSVLLPQALAQQNLSAVLASLPPLHKGYHRLRTELRQYRATAAQGGWPRVEGGDILRPGSRGPRVVQLRQRLRLSGDLPQTLAADPERFDNVLRRAVQHFQQRHGLQVDGRVGEATLAALNVPVQARIHQIEANMERWRWLPRQMEPRHILVNMAGYELQVIEWQQPVLNMRVIVGRDYRQTPVFSSTMTSLVLNPYWYVPRSIFRDDILPRLRREPDHLGRLDMRVFSRLNGNSSEVDVSTLDWNAVDGDSFPHTLRQAPGPHNALGQIKFMLPNRYGIFLHDTPDRTLFSRPTRAFSSGCIRLEDPVELARYVLADEERWNRAALDEAIKRGKPLGVKLPEPIPVYLVYWTAWVDEAGVLQLRDDIYGRDRLLLEAWRKNTSETVAAEPAAR